MTIYFWRYRNFLKNTVWDGLIDRGNKLEPSSHFDTTPTHRHRRRWALSKNRSAVDKDAGKSQDCQLFRYAPISNKRKIIDKL